MRLWNRAHDAAKRIAATAASVIQSYAEVFFLSKYTVGLVLFVGTLLNWEVGVAGLIAVVAALSFAKLAGLDERSRQAGYYAYNPLLVGLSLGANLSLTWLSALFIAVAGVLAFLLTAGLVHGLRYFLNLPALSLPFVLAAAVTRVAALHYSALVPASRTISPYLLDDYGLPYYVVGFCKALGGVFFVPSVLVGGAFALLLAARSRILFFLAVGGYAVGTLLRGALLGSPEEAHGDLMSFNFMLIAMALGGVFLVPSRTSLLAAAAAVAVSVILVDAVQVFGFYFAVPAYTLPFNLVTLGTLYALGVSQYSGLTRYFGATPEETLENDVVRRARFDAAARPLALPVLGRWTVWQACDDRWTHQGDWRYAYDFVITDDEGRTHAPGAARLSDFYCYRKPVVSPCRGRVVKVVDDLPDNPIGRVDQAENWGNHLVILDDRGFCVELSHFAFRTIPVRVGDRVEPGTPLGLCGNSGYSPQPHLHIHVQAGERLGEATLPFSFVRYFEGDRLISDGRPEKGQILQSAETDERLSAVTDYLLDDALRFEVRRRGRVVGERTLTVKMALDGTSYFESSAGGRLYFGKQNGTFYFYRVDGQDEMLRLIARSLPRLPMVRAGTAVWTDVVPLGLVTSGLRRAVYRLFSPLAPALAVATTEHRYVGSNEIETTVCVPGGNRSKLAVRIDPAYGLTSFRDGEWELRLLGDATDPDEEAPARDDLRTLAEARS
jgi:urea transporter